MDNHKLVILAILDGWGIAPAASGNAVSLANTPNMKRFWASFPHTQLAASAEAVGLPRGEVGNTETGHLNIGAGRVVYQDLARINMSIADGSFSQNEVLLSACTHAKTNNSQLHLMGLVGAGGVHSNLEHLFALIQMAAKEKVEKVYIHIFTDGRDSAPTSAGVYINKIREVIKTEGVGQIASIMGRYFAMDRDMHWERTAKAYYALTKGDAHKVKSVDEAIATSYEQGRTDEFIEPSIVSDAAGKPLTLIGANDSIIFFNFRIDRPRQLTKAFILDDWSKVYEDSFDPYDVKYTKKHTIMTAAPKADMSQIFARGEKLANLYFATMTEYSKTLATAGAKAAYPPEQVISPLGRVISDQGLKQLRVAESEKERFVTFYFNGQQEQAFPGEERLIVASPAVATYDKKPEMSAKEMTDALLGKIFHGEEYSFILINYANADMVGHTGSIGATVTACETIDQCLGKLASYVMAYNSVLLITADHGNAEQMLRQDTGEVNTEHSDNPVPFIAVAPQYLGKTIMLQSGVLADVAPTVLRLLNIEVPTNMIGHDLLASLKT